MANFIGSEIKMVWNYFKHKIFIFTVNFYVRCCFCSCCCRCACVPPLISISVVRSLHHNYFHKIFVSQKLVRMISSWYHNNSINIRGLYSLVNFKTSIILLTYRMYNIFETPRPFFETSLQSRSGKFFRKVWSYRLEIFIWPS